MASTSVRPPLAGTTDSEKSDAEILVRVRAGDTHAYGVLWHRHVRVALSVAGRYAGIADPEDIVQEAFQAIFTAIGAGGGPFGEFRPYLNRTVRNTAVNMARRKRADPVGGIAEIADSLGEVDEAFDDRRVERMVVVRAFRSLPDRWREILWLTAVEDLPTKEVAAMLGLTPNACSVLALRAREGLRRAWLAAHLQDGEHDAECRWVLRHVVLVERGAASEKTRRRIDEHTDVCDSCARAEREIGALSARLPALLVPIVLAGGEAAAWVLGGSVPGVVGGAASLAALGKVAVGWFAAPVTQAVAAGLLLVGAVAGIGTLLDGGSSGAPGTGAGGRPVAEETDAVDRSDDLPGAAAMLGVLGDPTATGADRVTPSSPGGTPPTPAGSPPSVAPVTVTSASAPGLREWLPEIGGRGEPGRQVEAVLADGTVVGSALVSIDGTWMLALSRDTAVDVEHTVSVRYAGEAAAVVVGTYSLVAPLTTGFEVVGGEAGLRDVVVLVSGVCGRSVEAVLDGAGEPRTFVLGECLSRLPFGELALGEHMVEVRYVDPSRGRVGAARTFSFEVE